MGFFSALASLSIVGYVSTQNVGYQKQETHLPMGFT